MHEGFDDPFGDGTPPPAGASPQAADVAPAFVAPGQPASSDKESPAGETKVARGGPVSGGHRAPVAPAPPLPNWANPDPQDIDDGADGDIDYSDLASLNRDLLRLRIRMNRARRAMRMAARDAVEAKLKYHRALRRALVQQSGGSAEARKASAELMCEELEADMVMKAQVEAEYTTLFRSVRDDIENAKVVAYNLRALTQIL